MRAALIVPEASKDDLDTLLALLNATNRLVKAFTSRYGGSVASSRLGPTMATIMAGRIKAMETIEPRIEGNNATLQVPADESAHMPGGTIKLQRTADGWKLDAASLFGLTSENQNLATTLRVARALTPVAQAIASDVEKRKFGSAKDAAQEFWARANAAIAAATQPALESATAPSTAPATLPAASRP
jgi:hypothetical protein